MSVPAQQDSTARQGVRRVLVYRLGSLGDTVVALPSLHMIARAFPGAERCLLTNFPVSSRAPAAAAVLGSSGLIDRYERYTVGTRNPLHLLALALRVRLFRPDVLVYLMPARGEAAARRDARFFRLACGIGHLVGVPSTEDMQQCRTGADGQMEFEASRLARNVAELGDAALESPASWNLRLSDEELKKADEVLARLHGQPFIAASIGTKVQAKDWGKDNWRALLGRLAADHPGYALVLAGVQEEQDASEFAAEAWRAGQAGPVVNLCGVLTPRESAAVFARASVFVGHDSGPMHLAACVQTPCVAIFAARNRPRVWFPYGSGHRVLYHRVDCWGCELETCLEQRKKCLLSITVDEVAGVVREVLRSPSRPGTVGLP